jgi:predicted metallopeptidase
VVTSYYHRKKAGATIISIRGICKTVIKSTKMTVIALLTPGIAPMVLKECVFTAITTNITISKKNKPVIEA